MATPRNGYENKRNCSECGQRTCKAYVEAYVNERLSDKLQASMIKACQDKNWKPIKR